MKLNDFRGRPAAQSLNRIIDAVDSSNEILTDLERGGPTLEVFKVLRQQEGYEIGDYAVRCDAPYLYPAINGYKVLKGRAKKMGLTRAEAQYIWSIAHQHRFQNNPAYWPGYEEPTDPNYGLIRVGETVAADMMLQEVPNTLGWIYGYKLTGGIDPDTGYPEYEIGSFYGTSEPTGDRVVIAGRDTPENPDNWTDVHDGGAPCSDPDQTYVRFADWKDDGNGPQIGLGPGWHAVYAGNGAFSDWPHHPLPPDNFPVPIGRGNFIGVVPDGYLIPGKPTLGSGVCILKVSAQQSFTFNELMASIPDGGEFVSAKLEMKASNLVRGCGSYADTITYDHGVPSKGSPTGDYQETTSTQGIIVLGTKVSAPRSRDWTVLGALNLSTAVSSDEWQVVDVTELINMLIQEHTNSRYTHFVFAPAIAREGLDVLQPGEAKSYLAGIAWDVQFGVAVNPNNQTPWKDGLGYDENGFFGYWGADVDYIASSSFSFVTWTDCQFGKLSLKWRYPDSEYGREALSYHLCPAN